MINYEQCKYSPNLQKFMLKALINSKYGDKAENASLGDR